MSILEKSADKRYTYKDYLTWSDNERWEIIEGVPYAMSPAPTWQHQSISRELMGQFWSYLKDKKCKVFAAPFDVRLQTGDEKDDEISNVVKPDITIVCDQSKLKGTGCEGTPDLIIEILSPSTMKVDLKEKLHCYERAGVKEYWIVNPEQKLITVYELGDDNKYRIRDSYFEDDKIRVGIFEDLNIEIRDVFQF